MEIESFFRIPVIVLKIIGIDVSRDGGGAKTFLKYFKTNLFFWLLITWLTVGGISSGIFGFIHFDNFELSSAANTNCIHTFVVIGKGIVIWWKRELIREIIADLKVEFDAWITAGYINEKAKKIFRKTFKSFNRFEKVYITLFTSTCVLFEVSPLAGGLASGVWEMKLPHPLWLPFDFTSVAVFMPVYIFTFYFLCLAWVS